MTKSSGLIDELLLAVGRGDQRAFKRLYDCTSPYLLSIFIRKLSRRDIAEELLQECYVRIWQKAATFDPSRGSALNWLSTIARNKAIDSIRARKPDDEGGDWAVELDNWASETPDLDREAEVAQSLRLIQKSLATLPLKMRNSVLLAHYSGFTNAESARLLHAPVGTVKSWIRRGVGSLRRDLQLNGRTVS